MEVTHYRPAVSLIMPFEPKMSLENELARSLKTAAGHIEKQLKKNYPDEVSEVVMKKFRTLAGNLDYTTFKKSIAIYVSPVFEKVIYLDIPVEEKIIIDESFEIRDLVYSKKEQQKYLVLLLSAKESRMFLGHGETLVKIVSNTPDALYALPDNPPEKVSNFSAAPERRQMLKEKFLLHIDNALGIILRAYDLPLFVIGADDILGDFKAISKNRAAVIDYIRGHYTDAGVPELKKILAPHITAWKKVKEKNLLNRLEEAAGGKKLVTGIKDVWREAMRRNGRLLLVEKNYLCAAQHGCTNEELYQVPEPFNKFSYIQDAVDDVIEKVLENGGDVEFTDEGVLDHYRHIALLKYY